MKEYNFKVLFETEQIITDLKQLVQNDYNTTKLNFTFDKEGRVLFKMLYPDGTQYVNEIENNELVFGKGVLNQEGTYEYEIALYTEDGRLTDHAIKSFEVRSELVDTDELVEPDDRVPVLDNLINEVNTIKQDVEDGKYNGKDGVDGTDGEDGVTPTIGDNGNWFIDGVDTGMPSQGPEGPQGPAGGVSLEEVTAITGALENLDTEDRSNLVNAINEVVSNSGGGDSPIIEAKLQSLTITNTSNSYQLDDTDKAIISDVITKAYANNDGYPAILLKTKGNTNFKVVSSISILDKPTSWYMNGFTEALVHSGQVSFGMMFINACISIMGTWEEDVFTCTYFNINLDRPQYLSKTNTRSYTPTGNYHPATKLYVDDAIAALKAELTGGTE